MAAFLQLSSGWSLALLTGSYIAHGVKELLKALQQLGHAASYRSLPDTREEQNMCQRPTLSAKGQLYPPYEGARIISASKHTFEALM